MEWFLKTPAVSVLLLLEYKRLKNNKNTEKVTCRAQIYRGNRVLNEGETCPQTSHFSRLLAHQKEQWTALETLTQ